MARPHKCRRVGLRAGQCTFKPVGVPASKLDEVELGLDELEAIRLADLEGLYHDAAAEGMNVSRATFGRIVASARHKIADALVNGKVLMISGGVVAMDEMRQFNCRGCGRTFEVPHGTGRPNECPYCHGVDFCRADSDRGQAHGGGQGRCRRQRRRACGGQGNRGVRGGASTGKSEESTT